MGCETQRAKTGDYENRDGAPQRGAPPCSLQEATTQGRSRNEKEPSGAKKLEILVCKPLDGSLLVLRVLDEPEHVAQLGLTASACLARTTSRPPTYMSLRWPCRRWRRRPAGTLLSSRCGRLWSSPRSPRRRLPQSRRERTDQTVANIQLVNKQCCPSSSELSRTVMVLPLLRRASATSLYPMLRSPTLPEARRHTSPDACT